jgi:ribose-phosphate pyrophosphokinase
VIYTIRYPQDQGIKYEQFRYPAGEIQVRLLPEQVSEITKAESVHVWATIRDGEIMGLAQLTNALDTLVPPVMTLFLPYLPYGRADRKFVVGDCFGLHVFAEFINALNYDQVITLDAHSEVAEIEINNLVNVSPKPLITTVIQTIGSDLAILLPDEGAERYQLGTSALRATKNRDPKTGKLSGFLVPPKDAFENAKSVLIVDDICDGGGTFVGIAEALKNYGLGLYLYVSHGIFSKGCPHLLKYFNRIYTTDSLPQSAQYYPGCHSLTIIPCGSLLLGAVLTREELRQNATK